MTAPQLKALLEAQAKTLTPQTAGGVMQKCAAAVQAKAEMVQSTAPAPKQAAKPTTQGR